MKIGLLGCAHIHTPDYVKRVKSRADVQVAGIWDHDSERASIYANELNAEIADDFRAITADPELEAVIICSETVLHEELVEAAVKGKKGIFIEKPLAHGGDSAWRMARSISRSGILFQTGFFQRSKAVYRFLRDEIKKKHFGKITRIHIHNCHGGLIEGWFDGRWRWMADSEYAGYGAFGDMGSHALDLLLWIMDAEIESVTATIHSVVNRPGIDAYGEGIIQFKNGIIATVVASWIDRSNPVKLIIAGTEGMAYVINDDLFYQSNHVRGANGKDIWSELPDSHPHAFELFLNALHDGKQSLLVRPFEAAECCQLIDALYTAAARQEWIKPALIRNRKTAFPD